MVLLCENNAEHSHRAPSLLPVTDNHRPGEPDEQKSGKVQLVRGRRPGQTTAAAQSGLCFPCTPDAISAFCGLLREGQALQMF